MPAAGGPKSAVPPGARRSALADGLAALPATFYARPAEQVARELLGCTLVAEVGGARCSGEIVETEAYTGPDDEASHGHLRFGLTARNRVMYGPPGIAYVYRIYGMHWCFNAVTGPEGFPAAVLVRAARPLEGVEHARQRRPGRPDRDLMRGPGNLCRALAIGGEHNGLPLDTRALHIAAGPAVADAAVATGPRIGISRAVDAPLRFWVRASSYVSR